MRERKRDGKDKATHFPFSRIKIKRQTTAAAAAAAAAAATACCSTRLLAEQLLQCFVACLNVYVVYEAAKCIHNEITQRCLFFLFLPPENCLRGEEEDDDEREAGRKK